MTSTKIEGAWFSDFVVSGGSRLRRWRMQRSLCIQVYSNLVFNFYGGRCLSFAPEREVLAPNWHALFFPFQQAGLLESSLLLLAIAASWVSAPWPLSDDGDWSSTSTFNCISVAQGFWNSSFT